MTTEDKKNFYIEPVEIEVYFKKAGRVRTLIKDLYIKLIDVKPETEHSIRIFNYFLEKDEPIDLMEVMNIFPEYMPVIFDSYYHRIALFEKLSMHYKEGLSGSIDAWRLSLYFTELLHKYEPTVASTKYLGNFQTHNLNYLIRKLNELNQQFLLEDSTVAFLIKRRNKAFEGKPRDRMFDKLVELWEFNVKEGSR
ncbi:MAG: hypothetical protein SVZ03_05065 [Spirochaetota bacterium]|nr:hypothetical protein [Spirochaetota bacterium]